MAIHFESPDLPDPARAQTLADLLRRASDAITDTIPTPGALLILFNPLRTTPTALVRLVEQSLPAVHHATSPERVWTIPTRYNGPDLHHVAERTGLSPEEVVRRHADPSYQVSHLGFAPGFAYLDGLSSDLVLPRRATPRTRVPAGSVAIAGRYTAIYPFATAGGWHLIGCTEVTPFQADRDPPALFAPGDRVRFVPA